MEGLLGALRVNEWALLVSAGGRCMRGGNFMGLISWGFKFQIKIGDPDFKVGILAETDHN